MSPSFAKTSDKSLFTNQKIVYRTKFRDYYRKAWSCISRMIVEAPFLTEVKEVGAMCLPPYR